MKKSLTITLILLVISSLFMTSCNEGMPTGKKIEGEDFYYWEEENHIIVGELTETGKSKSYILADPINGKYITQTGYLKEYIILSMEL